MSKCKECKAKRRTKYTHGKTKTIVTRKKDKQGNLIYSETKNKIKAKGTTIIKHKYKCSHKHK